MSPNSTTDPTLQFMNKLSDESLWKKIESAPIFIPHDRDAKGKDGEDIKISVGPDDLGPIAEQINMREQEYGVPPLLTIGHRQQTNPNFNEKNQPDIVGCVRHARIGVFGPKAAPAVLADLYVLKEHWEEARKYPFRSVDFYPGSNKVTGVALLKRDPFLPMGMIMYQAQKEAVKSKSATLHSHNLRAPNGGIEIDGECFKPGAYIPPKFASKLTEEQKAKCRNGDKKPLHKTEGKSHEVETYAGAIGVASSTSGIVGQQSAKRKRQVKEAEPVKAAPQTQYGTTIHVHGGGNVKTSGKPRAPRATKAPNQAPAAQAPAAQSAAPMSPDPAQGQHPAATAPAAPTPAPPAPIDHGTLRRFLNSNAVKHAGAHAAGGAIGAVAHGVISGEEDMERIAKNAGMAAAAGGITGLATGSWHDLMARREASNAAQPPVAAQATSYAKQPAQAQRSTLRRIARPAMIAGGAGLVGGGLLSAMDEERKDKDYAKKVAAAALAGGVGLGIGGGIYGLGKHAVQDMAVRGIKVQPKPAMDMSKLTAAAPVKAQATQYAPPIKGFGKTLGGLGDSFTKSPTMKDAAIGAGVGAIGNVAASALSGEKDSDELLNSALKGGVVGGAVGGVGSKLSRIGSPATSAVRERKAQAKANAPFVEDLGPKQLPKPQIDPSSGLPLNSSHLPPVDALPANAPAEMVDRRSTKLAPPPLLSEVPDSELASRANQKPGSDNKKTLPTAKPRASHLQPKDSPFYKPPGKTVRIPGSRKSVDITGLGDDDSLLGLPASGGQSAFSPPQLSAHKKAPPVAGKAISHPQKYIAPAVAAIAPHLIGPAIEAAGNSQIGKDIGKDLGFGSSKKMMSTKPPATYGASRNTKAKQEAETAGRVLRGYKGGIVGQALGALAGLGIGAAVDHPLAGAMAGMGTGGMIGSMGGFSNAGKQSLGFSGDQAPIRYDAVHAPAGGVTVAGKDYIGGQFIPANEMAKASPEEKEAVESPDRTKLSKQGPPRSIGAMIGGKIERGVASLGPKQEGWRAMDPKLKEMVTGFVSDAPPEIRKEMTDHLNETLTGRVGDYISKATPEELHELSKSVNDKTVAMTSQHRAPGVRGEGFLRRGTKGILLEGKYYAPGQAIPEPVYARATPKQQSLINPGMGRSMAEVLPTAEDWMSLGATKVGRRIPLLKHFMPSNVAKKLFLDKDTDEFSKKKILATAGVIAAIIGARYANREYPGWKSGDFTRVPTVPAADNIPTVPSIPSSDGGANNPRTVVPAMPGSPAVNISGRSPYAPPIQPAADQAALMRNAGANPGASSSTPSSMPANFTPPGPTPAPSSLLSAPTSTGVSSSHTNPMASSWPQGMPTHHAAAVSGIKNVLAGMGGGFVPPPVAQHAPPAPQPTPQANLPPGTNPWTTAASNQPQNPWTTSVSGQPVPPPSPQAATPASPSATLPPAMTQDVYGVQKTPRHTPPRLPGRPDVVKVPVTKDGQTVTRTVVDPTAPRVGFTGRPWTPGSGYVPSQDNLSPVVYMALTTTTSQASLRPSTGQVIDAAAKLAAMGPRRERVSQAKYAAAWQR